MQSEQKFVHRYRSGGCYSVLVLLLVFPVMAVTSFLPNLVSQQTSMVVLLGVLAVAAAFYALFVTEAELAIDNTTVRLSEQDVACGIRLKKRVLWEFPIDELTAAREVTTRTPSSRGGWIYSTELHFPGERTLAAGGLGGKADGKSAYDRLATLLRAQLGENFTTEEK